MGTPIPCPRTENPSSALIDEYHTKYMDALAAQYHKYKDVYAKARRHDVRFVH